MQHHITRSYLVDFYYVNASRPGHKIILSTITPVTGHTLHNTKFMGDFYGIYKALRACVK